MAHALLSASSADRWLHCPASVRLTEGMADKGSSYAAEGTLAHAMAEEDLRAFMEARDPDFSWHRQQPYFYRGMEEDIKLYTDYVKETFLAGAEELAIEQRLDFSEYVPGGFGTGDAVILSQGAVEIIDLKFGKGVPVSPIKNPQLMLYGLGAYLANDWLFDIDTVRMTIVQPRLDFLDTYEVSAGMLTEWARETVTPQAKLAYAGKGDLQAGSWCRWCKIKNTCRARASQHLEFYQSKSAGPELNTAEIADVLAQVDAIKAWLADIETGATETLTAGGEIPGWKLVEGRSNRKITDPEAMAEALKKVYAAEEIYKPQELKTLTALEKLVGKKAFASDYGQYVTKPPGKPTLAPESDKRPALNSPENEFTFE
ncbi:DUF2800 domain-containing protein [Peptococcus simiae]|uniref:DUF2800 domain-containing protein n=1 Tax=Peptococcus simiae TaxID=1643805 RepID=UPI00397ED395